MTASELGDPRWLDLRDHLRREHWWTDGDFELFGDTAAQQAMYLDGAHGQEHENVPEANLGHTHQVGAE